MSKNVGNNSQTIQEQKLRKLNDRIYNANYSFEFLVTSIGNNIMLLCKEGNVL